MSGTCLRLVAGVTRGASSENSSRYGFRSEEAPHVFVNGFAVERWDGHIAISSVDFP